MDAHRLDEYRFAQEYSATSAVAATFHDCTDFVVPANTLRTIKFMSYQCDVAENRFINIMVLGSTTHSLRGPVAYDGNNGAPFAILEQGNEVVLQPGDRIRFNRSAATAGSSMTLRVRYVDAIMPYQKQFEPQAERKRKSGVFPSSVFRRPGGGGGGGGVDYGGGGAGGGFPEGGGSGEPVL